MGSTASLSRLSPLNAWLTIFSWPALGAPRTLRGWQGLVALLSSDFLPHRSWRLKSDAKVAPAAPSSPFAACAPQKQQLRSSRAR
ncbi:hypothetical protein [Paenibacillus taichungensis]|uniref:hypothetical protein n=1 Tax=Paenibacillus taichungensis TaxID=484184 RepID=UPI001585FAAF|nr:hypothetical protein [Paenibacillus taichungensis]